MKKILGIGLLLLFFVSVVNAGDITEYARIVTSAQGEYTLDLPGIDVEGGEGALKGYRAQLSSVDLISWTIVAGSVVKSDAKPHEKAMVRPVAGGYSLEIPYLEYSTSNGSYGLSAEMESSGGASWILKMGSVAQKELLLPDKIEYVKGELTVGEQRWEIGASDITGEEVEGLGNVILAMLYLGESATDYALISLDDEGVPDGRLVQVQAGGTTYTGFGLDAKEEAAAATGGEEDIIVVSGELADEKGVTLASVLKVGPSLVAGVGTTHFRIDGNKAYLNGTLGKRTFNQVVDLIGTHPEVDTIVEENVPGSVDDDTNMETGRLIRKFGLATHVSADGEISSGGVDLFCAGVKRSLEKGATVGVHSWGGGVGPDAQTAQDFPEDHPAHHAQISYFSEMLGAPLGRGVYFFTLAAAPFDGMHNMTEEEIERWKLTTP